MKEIDFYKNQVKIATRNCGFINAGNIDEYIARGGYFSLQKVFSNMDSGKVIEEDEGSGFRGRGEEKKIKAFLGNNNCNSVKALKVIDKDRVFHGMIEK